MQAVATFGYRGRINYNRDAQVGDHKQVICKRGAVSLQAFNLNKQALNPKPETLDRGGGGGGGMAQTLEYRWAKANSDA